VDAYCRLREFQLFRGEKPGLDVYSTAVLFSESARSRFQRRYGFDPLATIDEPHRTEALHPEFVIGRQPTETKTHALALIHEDIIRRAGVPVIAFDPPNPLRVWVPGVAGSSVIPAGRDSAAAR
jgi:hypothetical protein